MHMALFTMSAIARRRRRQREYRVAAIGVASAELARHGIGNESHAPRRRRACRAASSYKRRQGQDVGESDHPMSPGGGAAMMMPRHDAVVCHRLTSYIAEGDGDAFWRHAARQRAQR